MAVHTILLTILILVNYAECQPEDCVLHAATREDAWDKKIHKNLQQNYESDISPNNNTCVPISIYFQLKSFSLDEQESMFTALVWSRLKWHDERLMWSPEDNGEVDKIIMSGIDIWMPSIKLLNSIQTDADYGNELYFGDCLVSYDGEILCVPELTYKSFCRAKLKNWPYDVQDCTLNFGTSELLYGIAMFNLTNSSNVMFTMSAEYDSGWNIMNTSTKINDSDVVQLSITLTLARQDYGLVVILLIPSIIIAVLTLTAAFLSVKDSVRLGFLCFSLICHFIFLIAIEKTIPVHTGDTPVILLFIRSSMIITVTSILISSLLSTIIKMKKVPFVWVTLISDKTFNGFGKYFIYPKWELAENPTEINDTHEVWTHFANIVNNLFLFIVAVIYVILFSDYMPEQPPYE